ncbi:MAG: inositol monophosphatase [Deltaproteobacteria bacterium]|jgi:myo-inositol-1(or 4)-monophosphatase|nr:inositol monophosphatase [Deltaproteobacteria bacterium]
MRIEHITKEKDELLDIAISAVNQAGLILREHFTLNAGIASDKGRDIKTEADKAADEAILKILSSTGYSILSEESGSKSISGLEPSCWIIDPLDGTFNFVRGFPACCVSVALWDKRNPLLGVIYDFANDRLYYGKVGAGAFCNGLPLRVSSVNCFTQAALATGFPTSRDFSDNALLTTIRRIQKFKKIRMIGSAALSLAYVSAGIVDAYHEEDIWLWDVAAGLALVRAAGGDFTISEIKPTWQLDVYASNGIISI